MKVSDLIGLLSKMPQDSRVRYFWNGDARSEVLYVWESNDGSCVLSDEAAGDYRPYSKEFYPKGGEPRRLNLPSPSYYSVYGVPGGSGGVSAEVSGSGYCKIWRNVCCDD